MNILPTIAVLLLSLVGYSLGTAMHLRRRSAAKPTAVDIFVVSLLWTCVICSRAMLPLSKWILLAASIAAGIVLGYLMALFRGY